MDKEQKDKPEQYAKPAVKASDVLVMSSWDLEVYRDCATGHAGTYKWGIYSITTKAEAIKMHGLSG